MPYPYADDRAELLSRLRKIEGQVRGIQRMVDEDSYCVDVLTQITAVVSGMEKVGTRLLRQHLEGCVAEAIRDEDGGKDKIDEVVKVVERFLQA